MQTFYINKGSVLPKLRMELIDDGTYDYIKSYRFNNAIQNADVTFTMLDANNRLRISKQPATIQKITGNCCEDRYILEYEWKPRDVKEPGEFIGKFEITFKSDLYEEGVDYDGGNLIVPIVEDLVIFIKNAAI
jgi:hypothetical protein